MCYMILVDELKKKTINSKDYIYKKLIIDNIEVYVLFNEVLVSSSYCNDFILRRLTTLKRRQLNNLVDILPDSSIIKISEQEIFKYINMGFCVVIVNNDIYAIETKAMLDRGIATSESELSLKGRLF